MLFKFNVNLSDKDYLNFNIFCAVKSYYGKKQITRLRIIISLFFCAFEVLTLIQEGFSADAFMMLIPFLLALVLVQALIKPIHIWTVKLHIKSLNKSEKKRYSPETEIEFYEESFIDTAPEKKMEAKYSSLERVSVVNGEAVYLHHNNLLGHILPMAVFESKTQYDSFIAFIKTKCNNVDVY